MNADCIFVKIDGVVVFVIGVGRLIDTEAVRVGVVVVDIIGVFIGVVINDESICAIFCHVFVQNGVLIAV